MDDDRTRPATRIWNDRPVWCKVVVGMLVPLAAFGVLLTDRALDSRADASDAADVAAAIDTSILLGDLLHETQKERGRTAQFLSASGERFGPELAEQRALTDTRV
ncbi:MAG: nitrate- and nitrite sensing domain-containing protein, partial [Actinomycetota bacterium]